MDYFSPIAEKNQLKFCLGITLLVFICCEMLMPIKGWAQAISDTGSFYFTGSHNPLRRPIFREWLPGDGLRAGQVRVHPFLGIAEIYTDNVFRSNQRRRSDFLTTIAPGIQVNVPIANRHSFLLDYRAAQFLYSKFSENNALAQHGVGHIKLDFPSGLKVDLQGGHLEGFDRRGADVDIQQDDITKWNSNSFLGETEFLGANIGIRLRLAYRDLHFKNNNQSAPRDRKTIRTRLTFLVPASQFASGLLGLSIRNSTYDENKQLDNFSYEVFTGFRLKKSQLLSGEFRIGYRILNFDRAPVEDPVQIIALQDRGLSRGGKQQKRLNMSGNIIWTPTTQILVNVRPFRDIQQGAVFNSTTFTRTGVSIFTRKGLTPRTAVRAILFYTHNDFENFQERGNRRDDQFLWRMGLEYKTVEWLGFRLSYIFEKRFSDQNAFDFYSNTFMFSVQGLL